MNFCPKGPADRESDLVSASESLPPGMTLRSGTELSAEKYRELFHYARLSDIEKVALALDIVDFERVDMVEMSAAVSSGLAEAVRRSSGRSVHLSRRAGYDLSTQKGVTAVKHYLQKCSTSGTIHQGHRQQKS